MSYPAWPDWTAEEWRAAKALHSVAKFDPNQPRDEKGRWVTLYHGTRESAVPSILKEGLISHGGIVWATESREEAQRFAEGLDYPHPTLGATVVEIRAPKSAFFFEKPLTPGKKNPPGTRVARFPVGVRPEWLVTKFDPNQARDPKGVSTGGQFTKEIASDPALAEQAKTGIAAIEKLLPEAIKTTNFSFGSGGAWIDLNEESKRKVQVQYGEEQYDYTSVHLYTGDLDDVERQRIREDQGDEITAASEKALRTWIEGRPTALGGTTKPPIDMSTVVIDDKYQILDAHRIRRTDGLTLSTTEYAEVTSYYSDAFREELGKRFEKYQDTDEYLALREKLVLETVEKMWRATNDEERYQLAVEMRLRGDLPGELVFDPSLRQRPPEEWVTGVKGEVDEDTGEEPVGGDNYERTRAIALRLTEMRTDEIRRERGLPLAGDPPKLTFKTLQLSEQEGGMLVHQAYDEAGQLVMTSATEENVRGLATEWAGQHPWPSSEKLIEEVWNSWKTKSSEGVGLSLQLAAARELGGVHRMTPDEVKQAEDYAKPLGGMPVLQAYVRAQWEVTQTIMAKAHEDKVDVYRAVMLPGEHVNATTNLPVDKLGGTIPPPTNIKETHPEGGAFPVVTFDFHGEHFGVEKHHLPIPAWKDVEPETQKRVQELFGLENDADFAPLSDQNKAAWLAHFIAKETIPRRPYESNESAVQRQIAGYMSTAQFQGRGMFVKLPDLKLQRAGAQSTTGTRSVANDWGGVGDLPPNPERVVIRIEAPPTSVLSLPVYGKNIAGEHESVLIGTKDRWIWDAWREKAPDFASQHVAHKADRPILVVDLQAEDRGRPHWLSSWQSVAKKEFEEALHPRNPEGTPEGGQFTASGGQGQEAVSDPVLAEQAKVALVSVEKHLPEAIKTANYKDIEGFEPESWSDVSDDLQDKVRDKWYETAYEDVEVDTTYLDREAKKELQTDNQAILDQAMSWTEERLKNVHPPGQIGKALFPDPDPTLPIEGAPFQLRRMVDSDTIDYGAGEHEDGTVAIDLEALRFTSGEPLTPQEQQIVQDIWDENYRSAYKDTEEAYFDSDKYSERRNELEQEAIDEAWRDMDDSDKLSLLNRYGLASGPVPPGRPDHWVTGIEKENKGDEDYGRTHAVAARLTELRTDELLKERGLTEIDPEYEIKDESTPNHPNFVTYYNDPLKGELVAVASSNTLELAEANSKAWADKWAELGIGKPKVAPARKIVTDVWDEWKSSSSEGLSLSLQLAAAKELGGHHRLSTEEIATAVESARKYGGIAVLQAYVRAQWEVTQYVMDQAGQKKADVYRALMLEGNRIAQTPKERLDNNGKLLDPPTNIKIVQDRVAPELDTPDKPPLKEYVAFDYAGEHFVVEKRGHLWGELEPNEEAIQRRLNEFHESSQAHNFFIRLPELKLRRAGAQSTTGTPSVANDWGGVGNLPANPKRVVIRIEAPPTSVLSLPVYGKNSQQEHESVLIGTKDKWLWDAWLGKAPTYWNQPIVRKAEMPPSDIIDLQAEDRGKPHWMSSIKWSQPPFVSVLKWSESQHPRDTEGKFTEGVGHGQTTTQPDAGARAGGGRVQAATQRVPAAAPAAAPAAPKGPVGVPEAQDVANRYNKAHGFPPVVHGYAKVDEARAGAIADAFDALPVDDHANPKVKEAYAALATEVQAQWDHILASGMQLVPWTKEGQPYKNSKEMRADVQTNHRLYFFQGGEPHPMLGEKDPTTGLSINDKFRAVHDYFGHAAGGYDFGPRGEENAWISHSQMLSPEARRALTTETRGQNSWVNFGRQNYNADGTYKNIPPQERPYAIQKTAIFPDTYVFSELSTYRSILKWDRNQPRGPKGSPTGGQWVKGVSQGLGSASETFKPPEYGFGSTENRRMAANNQASFAAIMNAPTGTGFGNKPRLTGDPELVKRLTTVTPDEGSKAIKRRLALEKNNAAVSSPLDPGGHVNVTLKVALDDEDSTTAVFKPELGESWKGDFVNNDITDYIRNKDFSLAEREAFASEVDTALGLGLVPDTVHRTTLGGVDLSDMSSGDSGPDSYDLRERYEAYEEKARERADEVVSEEFGNLFDEAQKDHANDLEKRQDELIDIWNELIDKEYPDLPSTEVLAGQREHPVLPLGPDVPPFERRTEVGPIDPIELMDEAKVNADGALTDDERLRVEAVMRHHLDRGGQELGDLDEEAAREHLDRDQWYQDHADTERRLYESKIQSFDSWKQSQGYNSGGSGGGAKNPDAPHPEGGSLQHFVGGLEDSGDPSAEDLRKLAVLDYAIGSMDRHYLNAKFREDKLVAIDNGYIMPDVNIPDGFTFRSTLVRRWTRMGGDDRLVPKAERDKLLAQLEMADWTALLARHPNMTRGERHAFLGRLDKLKVALKYDAGLKDLWSGLDIMQ